jgi:phage shock protein E
LSNRSKKSRGSDRAGGRNGSAGSGAGSQPNGPGSGGILGSATQLDPRTRIGVIIVMLILGALVVMATDFVLGALDGGSSSPSRSAVPTASGAANAGAAASTQLGVIVPGVGGHWTNVSAGQLADMLTRKDFTLVNVKTPYIGEIDGTDLYLPYDQLEARASQLPADKGAKVLVYCRSGAESAQAAQTLLDLGYHNVWNLDGGMNAWTASGRKLVQKNR